MNCSLRQSLIHYQGRTHLAQLVEMGAAALESTLRVLWRRRNGPVGCRRTTRELIRTDAAALRLAREKGIA